MFYEDKKACDLVGLLFFFGEITFFMASCRMKIIFHQ